MSIIDNEFLDEIKKFRPGECAFRGQVDANWELQSSATRRLATANFIRCADINELSGAHVQHIYRKYHYDELINPARTFGFDIEEGVKISDFQLLAKLQHFGAATGLIDFTWNPLVALWFACENESDEDGKVFIVNLNDTNIYKSPSPSSKKEESMKFLFPSDEGKSLSLYWEPKVRSEAAARILRQHSVFVLPRSPVMEEGVKNIVIKGQHKKEIKNELAGLGISEQSLFLDIHGFSMINRANSHIRRMNDPHAYFMQGNKFYQQGDYTSAIRSYTQCIDAIPADTSVREPYYLRGNAKAAIRDYKGAIEDYDSANKGTIADMMSYRVILNENVTVYDNEWDRPWIFFNRGNANFELKKYKDALQDYENAIQVVRKLGLKSDIATIKFNRANTKVMLGRYDEAIKDYGKVVSIESEGFISRKNALFNKGNTLIIALRFNEALQCYGESMQAGYSKAEKNMKCLEALTQNIGEKNYEHKINIQHDESICIVITINGDSETYKEFPFDGNVGNTGNFGGNRLPGGEGYSGGRPFKVIVKAT